MEVLLARVRVRRVHVRRDRVRDRLALGAVLGPLGDRVAEVLADHALERLAVLGPVQVTRAGCRATGSRTAPARRGPWRGTSITRSSAASVGMPGGTTSPRSMSCGVPTSVSRPPCAAARARPRRRPGRAERTRQPTASSGADERPGDVHPVAREVPADQLRAERAGRVHRRPRRRAAPQARPARCSRRRRALRRRRRSARADAVPRITLTSPRVSDELHQQRRQFE